MRSSRGPPVDLGIAADWRIGVRRRMSAVSCETRSTGSLRRHL